MWWNDVRCENRFNVMWDELCDAQCNLKPTNYVKTTALLMWKAHTHAWNQWHISCTQSYQSPDEKRWEGRVKWYCGRKIYICYKVWCGMVCCMMWNVCGLNYRVWSGAVWCEEKRVAWNGGVKLQCGVILNVLRYGYIKLCVAFRAVCSFCIM